MNGTVIWTEKTTAKLRTLASDGCNAKMIAEAIGVTVDALRWRARSHKIIIGGANSQFTEREDRVIRDMAHLGWKAVADELGRGRESITRRAAKLGVKTGLLRTWSDADDATLIKMAARGQSYAEIEVALGRSYDAVSNRAKRLGVLRVRLAGGKAPPPPPAKKNKPNPPELRKCLTCQTMFPSSWIGNRRCKPCKSSVVYQNSGSAMI